MQVASVSKMFYHVAAGALALPEIRWYLTGQQSGPGRVPPQLDSTMLLSWAPRVTHVDVDDYFPSFPGSAKFVSAASRLAHVLARCESPLAAAQLDRVFKGNGTITGLECWCSYVPCLFPSSLRELRCISNISQCPADDQQANAFIVRLDTWVMGLRSLVLNLECCPVLNSHTILPMLDTLSISFRTSSTPVQLSWLHRQPCKVLDLRVDIHEDVVSEQVQASSVIEGLSLHQCSISFWCPLSHDMQYIWEGVSALTVIELNMYYEAQSLVAFPSSPHLDISMCHLTKSLSCDWTALVRRPCSIKIDAYVSDSVIVNGCPDHCQIPFAGTTHPWQLCLDDCGHRVTIFGLPASQECRGVAYFLQNDAAIAAGWTKDTGTMQ